MKTREPFYECPSFEPCSCNQCPLDPKMMKRTIHPNDPEQRCRATRPTRERIAAKYPGLLATGGRTLREVAHDKRSAAAKERLAAMAPEDRQALLDRFETVRRRGQ
jgi:hypothetical protein